MLTKLNSSPADVGESGAIRTGSVITPLSTMITFGSGGTSGTGEARLRTLPGVTDLALRRLGVLVPATRESSSLPSKPPSSAKRLWPTDACGVPFVLLLLTAKLAGLLVS